MKTPVIAFALAGCRIGFDPITPPSPALPASDAYCDGDVLHEPAADGSDVASGCGWGCLASPEAHCGQLIPAGGALAASDVAPHPGLADVTLAATTITFDGDTGEIDTSNAALPARDPGLQTIAGIDFDQSATFAMFRFQSLHLTGTVRLSGSRSFALIVDGELVIDGQVLAGAPCSASAPQVPGPGGFAGGSFTPGEPDVQGECSPGSYGDAGAGGGNGGAGGTGGGVMTGGRAVDPNAYVLVGGGGGGDGTSGSGLAHGGGGGGALQLVSNTRIELTSGGIDASGCAGTLDYSGGGGGAGGTLLLEAPAIILAGALRVDGGAGAAGTTATAGPAGGTGAAPDGADGGTFEGGGGGVGRMRFETLPGGLSVSAGGVLDPSLDDHTTTTSIDATVE
jgi:hypothetical protein